MPAACPTATCSPWPRSSISARRLSSCRRTIRPTPHAFASSTAPARCRLPAIPMSAPAGFWPGSAATATACCASRRSPAWSKSASSATGRQASPAPSPSPPPSRCRSAPKCRSNCWPAVSASMRVTSSWRRIDRSSPRSAIPSSLPRSRLQPCARRSGHFALQVGGGSLPDIGAAPPAALSLCA